MSTEKYARQSFLGHNSTDIIQYCRVGIVGLGGGGSHIVQQLAHLGFRDYVLYDPDIVKYVNLNRTVGATLEDAEQRRAKGDIATRMILGLEPRADIKLIRQRWQEAPGYLQGCDIIFGCLDGYAERRELEICARRHLIPYIDIGMDVHKVANDPPEVSGQVILSMPAGPCLTCLGFLTETKLTKEAALYGAAGPRPQVVWPNGVLASTAIGIAVNLLTDWSQSVRTPIYLSYRGSTGTLEPHVRLKYAPQVCEHFPLRGVGRPRGQSL